MVRTACILALLALLPACKGDKKKTETKPDDVAASGPVQVEADPERPALPAAKQKPRVEKPGSDAAALQVYRAITDEKERPQAGRLFERKRPIVVKVEGGEMRKVKGAAEFEKLVAELDPAEMKLENCVRECCEFVPANEGQAAAGAQLRKICFDVDRHGSRTVSSMTLSNQR
jgi:hypothetical protein